MSFSLTLFSRNGNPWWYSAFTLLILLMPLPFGSNRPWASDLFGVITGLCLALALWQQRSAEPLQGKPPFLRLKIAAAFMTVVILWSFVQVSSWTPTSLQHPVWQESAELLGPVKGSISVDPDAYSESLVRLLGYIACFITALFAFRERERAKRFVGALALAGAAYAFYGLIAQAGGSDTILWYKKWAYHGFLTSTFVNKNSYAAYAGLGLLAALAFLWNQLKDVTPKDAYLAQQSKFAAFVMALRLKDYALFLIPVLLLAALAMTGSRAGVVSTLVGVAAFVLSLAVHRRIKTKQWVFLGGAGALLFILFVAVGGEALLTRMDKNAVDGDAALRLSGYSLTLQAIEDNPLLGYGLGSFDKAFRLYRDETLPLWYHHAHNDYLEMMMDLGVPAALLLFASLALLVSCCIGALWQRRRDGIYPALAIGATALLATHALVDFSFHIPAIAATYAALLGLGVAQSWSSREAG